MGLFDGRKRILSFEIVFDKKNKVGVSIDKHVSMISTLDYIRLWACYAAKMIYVLGYPDNVSANIAIGAIAKIVKSDINASTNCFQIANLDDVIQYTSKYTGEFYAKGSLERAVKTWVPKRATEQQTVFSALALMQNVIYMIRNDKDCLEVLTQVARNMVELYDYGMGEGIASVVEVPTLAYMRAIGIAEE